MAAKAKSFADVTDRVTWLLLSAPDRFPTTGSFSPDQSRNLQLAFELVLDGFPYVERKVKDPAVLEKLRGLVRESLMAYQQGDRKRGALLLQAFLNIVSPDRFKEYQERKVE